jgi:hypothetical protein
MQHLTILSAAALVALSACMTSEEFLQTTRPPTKAQRAAIVEAARDVLLDPYSVRDAEISDVGQLQDGRQFVCVKANAKNALGGYTGREALGVFLRGSQPVGSATTPVICNHPSLRWQRFPELENLSRL